MAMTETAAVAVIVVVVRTAAADALTSARAHAVRAASVRRRARTGVFDRGTSRSSFTEVVVRDAVATTHRIRNVWTHAGLRNTDADVARPGARAREKRQTELVGAALRTIRRTTELRSPVMGMTVTATKIVGLLRRGIGRGLGAATNRNERGQRSQIR
jgi:hypothetical protein